MKNYLLLLCVFCALSVASLVEAQNRVGIIISRGRAFFSHPKVGVTTLGVGGVIDFGLNNRLAVRIPMYLEKAEGDIADDGLMYYSEMFKFKYKYLEIPVLLKLGAGKDIERDRDRAYLITGPTFGVNVEPKKSGLRDFDFGLIFGFGAILPLNKAIFFIDLSFRRGLRDLNNGSRSIFNKMRNDVLQLTGGIMLPW